jgi:signal transduction histidine kinase
MTGASVGRPAGGTSLSFRLVAAALVWLALLLALGGAVLALAFRNAVEEEFGYRLDAVLKAVIASTEVTPDGRLAMLRPLGDPRFERIFSGWYWQVTGPDGRRVRSRSLWDSTITTVDGGSEPHTRRIAGPNGEPLLVVERDLQFPAIDGTVHVLVAGDMREVSDGVRRFDLLLLLALGTLGAGMALAVVIQVRYGLRPLHALAADLAAVREGRAPHLPGRYPREIVPLADAMNGVLDKDADLIERARHHVGNLAHGLKTPLAVLAAELQSTPDKTVMTEQVQVMRRLIDHHLGRAAATAGTGRTPAVRTMVRGVADAIAAALGKVYAERGLAIEIDAAADAAFRGHRADLEEILGNLTENACKWARGHVRVTATTTNGSLRLVVEDDGPGLPAVLPPGGMQRGRRFDELAPGWGLGLAIVSDLVEVNGGRMAFAVSPLGGLAATIDFPVESPIQRG